MEFLPVSLEIRIACRVHCSTSTLTWVQLGFFAAAWWRGCGQGRGQGSEGCIAVLRQVSGALQHQPD